MTEQSRTGTSRRGMLAASAAAALALPLALGRGVAAQAQSFFRPPVPGSRILVSGCVIRFSDPDGSPSIHANAAHGAFGVESVNVDPTSGWLELHQTPMHAPTNPIIFAQAQADETLVARGISAGASGGTTRTRFAMYDSRLGRSLDLRNRSDRMRLQGEHSNLWVGLIHVPNAWTA